MGVLEPRGKDRSTICKQTRYWYYQTK